MTKTILLDFDGVIFREHALHNIVSRRCRQFVKRYVRVKDPHVLREINKSMYESTGHTLLGLKKLGYNISRDEFNKYVYDHIDYGSHLKEISPVQRQEIEHLKLLKDKCLDEKWDLHVFSNAPDFWCNTISHELFNFTLPTTTAFTNGYFKPDERSYKGIDAHFNASSYVFVDDKMVNLLNVPKDGRWSCVFMNDHVTQTTTHLNLIQSLGDLL